MSAFKGCPHLQRVTFSGFPPFFSDRWQTSRSINPLDTSLPWTQLTDLNFYGIAVPCHSVLQVLRQCGRLCVLTVTLFSIPVIWHEELVILSTLSTLCVFVQPHADPALFFLNISLPMLKELEITFIDNRNVTMMDVTLLLGLQSNSAPFPLSSFGLYNCALEEQHIPAMLDFLHGVSELQKLMLPIDQAVNSTPVLAALTLPRSRKGKQAPFLPVLRSLSLVGPWHCSSQKEWSRATKAVARMVKSRHENSHLREFVLASDAEIVSPGRDLLREISRHDLHVQVFLRRPNSNGLPLLIPYDLSEVIQTGHQYSLVGGVLRDHGIS